MWGPSACAVELGSKRRCSLAAAGRGAHFAKLAQIAEHARVLNQPALGAEKHIVHEASIARQYNCPIGPYLIPYLVKYVIFFYIYIYIKY